MAMLEKAGREKFSIINIIKTIHYRIKFRRENPDYFDADGLLIFAGAQGTGKTISAVNYIYKLLEMYPMAKLVTNVYLKDYPFKSYADYKNENIERYKKLINSKNKFLADKILYNIYLEENRVFLFNDNDDFMKYSNGQNGVIFFVDEIQLYLNSLESKNINLEVITQISQQRKQRKHIVATSQVFGRMAKPLREQFSNVIACKCYLNCIQINKMIDRDSLESDDSTSTNISGKVKRTFIWTHNPIMYKRYDTYQVIEKGKFVAGEKQRKEIYNDEYRLSTNNK